MTESIPIILIGAAGRILRPGGRLLFTVERAAGSGSGTRGRLLQASGRFAHTPAHLRRAAARTALEVEALEEAVLRREFDEPVSGLVALMRRPG